MPCVLRLKFLTLKFITELFVNLGLKFTRLDPRRKTLKLDAIIYDARGLLYQREAFAAFGVKFDVFRRRFLRRVQSCLLPKFTS